VPKHKRPRQIYTSVSRPDPRRVARRPRPDRVLSTLLALAVALIVAVVLLVLIAGGASDVP
jgi:hypothetical protein